MITIGAYYEGDKTYYYGVVRGKALRRSYPGRLGLLQALAEAYGDEQFLSLREYVELFDLFRDRMDNEAFETLLVELAELEPGHGMTLTVAPNGEPMYSYTDESGEMAVEADGMTPQVRYQGPQELIDLFNPAASPGV